MQFLKKCPSKLRPYIFHGVERLHWNDDATQATGDCPWCGREEKFTIEIETGRWRCFVCAEGSKRGGGNIYTFIRHLWKRSDEATTDYKSLAYDRGLIYPETLMRWGVARSLLVGDWLIPAYAADGTLRQLYRYVGSKGKKRLLPTPTLGHQLFGLQLFDKNNSTVYLCEGPWDAMALWEAAGEVKQGDVGFLSTANVDNSVRATAGVLAVAGCGAVGEPFKQCLPLFGGKDVNLMFDSDYPRKHSKMGNITRPAGLEAMQRAAKLLSESASPPASINFLRWGEQGYDRDLPSGYDVRDFLNA